ncbi:MAG: hypothetical protein IPM94_15625 [bacterium]|nr:hypothetical protein [bacterium]
MVAREPSILFDPAWCVGCVACSQVHPTKQIRVAAGCAVVGPDLCASTATPASAAGSLRRGAGPAVDPADPARFKYKVAIPSMTLYAQFGRDIHPSGCVSTVDLPWVRPGLADVSWMNEMVAGAIDASFGEAAGPAVEDLGHPPGDRGWQVRHPDLPRQPGPERNPAELAAKVLRRRVVSRAAAPAAGHRDLLYHPARRS